VVGFTFYLYRNLFVRKEQREVHEPLTTVRINKGKVVVFQKIGTVLFAI
jgi:hypothetical protein